MKIALRYFAAARECAGCEGEALELADATDLPALLTHLAVLHPRLAPLLPRLRVAVNQAFVALDAPLPDGAEVALIPPVAGGAGPLCALRETPLSIDEAVDAVSGAGFGGIAVFVGAVRELSHGKQVVQLDYEAYPGMAERTLRAIADAAAQRFGARVAILHRTGTLKVGERAVVIAAAAAHRAEAFDACRFAIEELKRDVPIWKKEHYTDGEEWIGLGP